jgi:hypothetical protein
MVRDTRGGNLLLRSMGRGLYLASSVWPMPIWHWIGHRLFRGLRTQRVGTITIGTDSSATIASDLLVATAAALRLIGEADPRRFSRIMLDVDRIVVTEFTAAVGVHFPRSRTCFMSTRFVPAIQNWIDHRVRQLGLL